MRSNQTTFRIASGLAPVPKKVPAESIGRAHFQRTTRSLVERERDGVEVEFTWLVELGLLPQARYA
jgi:hypothetical protein